MFPSSHSDFTKKIIGIFFYLFMPLDVFNRPTGGYNHSNSFCQKILIGLFTKTSGCHDSVKKNEFYDRIPTSDLAVGTIILSQSLIGTLGNLFLLCHYILLCHTGFRLRTTDLFLIQLTISNTMVILSKCALETVEDFGFKYFFSDLGCKLILYVQRVARGASISITCLLSVFQTIMVSPMNSCWKDLKAKAAKYVGFSISLCWILYMLVNLIFPMYTPRMPDNCSSKELVKKRDLLNYSVDHEKIISSIYAVLVMFPEVFFTVLIIWASASMVIILLRHKQQVQHLHKNSLSKRSSAESRVTRSILLLVGTFACFHILSSIFYFCLTHLHTPSLWLMNITELTSIGFATVSPFVLMIRDSSVFRVSFAWLRNRKSPQLIQSF